MANATYNRGLYHLGEYNWDTDAVDIGVMLVYLTGGTAYTFLRTHNTVNDVVASEAAGAGYARKPIAAAVRTLTEDDGANAAYFKVTDGSVSWVGINCGLNTLAVVLYFVVGGDLSDNTADLLGYYDTGTNVPIITNGGDVALNFNASGAIKLT